ncbi:hypothetical protein VTO42DRAFT_4398 [Malbranchea cinnamomea]
MPRPQHNTTLLPKKLREELGLPDTYNPNRAARGRKKPGSVLSRKEQRKAEREQKKAARRPGTNPAKDQVRVRENGIGKATPKSSSRDAESILKKRRLEEEDGVESDFSDVGSDLDEDILDESDDNEIEDEGSEEEEEEKEEKEEEPSRPKIPKSVQEKLDEDDAEIARLEKALGIKNHKLPKSFQRDGLDEILGDLAGGSDVEQKKRKREGDDWLQRKRQKALAEQKRRDISSDDDESETTGSEDQFALDEDNESEAADSFDGFEDEYGGTKDQKAKSPLPKKNARENPYVPPVSATITTTTAKYVPPSLRAASSSNESEDLVRLRRQTQGQLNKLSEANMVSILSEIEKIYQNYPRQNVTTTLIDLLLALICDRSTLNDTFINLHAGFIAAVYKVIGMDFGAQLVERMVKQFDAVYEGRQNSEEDDSNSTSKEMSNLVALLAHMYNLHVIGCELVFDYIRLFLKEINQLNTELLLKIIKISGQQLRQDDPSSLKDIVLLVQPAVARVGEAALSVRTKFMIETITDLKNNKLKSTFSGNISEHITRMRKILGSLNSRNIKASEPLRIGREDIHNSEKRGKWWLVGASWKDDDASTRAETGHPISNTAILPDTLDDDFDTAAVDLVQLAKAHRMNTDVRRSIFVAIMSATDCRDAHVRLTKLRLKRKQEVEIPHVLIHCASEEETYNPYYTLIARKLCGENRMKKAFMFALWDVFKRMGERNDMDDNDSDDGLGFDDAENALSTRAVVNLAKMFGNLVAEGALALGILKTLDFLYLQPKTRTFVELLLITAILQTQQKPRRQQKHSDQNENSEFDEKPLVDVFMRIRDTPQVVTGLIYFIRKVVAKSDIVSSKKEKKTLRWGCRVALDTLKVVSEGESGLFG